MIAMRGGPSRLGDRTVGRRSASPAPPVQAPCARSKPPRRRDPCHRRRVRGADLPAERRTFSPGPHRPTSRDQAAGAAWPAARTSARGQSAARTCGTSNPPESAMVAIQPRPLLAAILLAAPRSSPAAATAAPRPARGCEDRSRLRRRRPLRRRAVPGLGAAGGRLHRAAPALVTQREIDAHLHLARSRPGRRHRRLVVDRGERRRPACDAEVSGAGRGRRPTVVFWCPGAYRIGLTVTDSSGEESAPVDRTVEVRCHHQRPDVCRSPATGLVHHRCSGSPLRCTLESGRSGSRRRPAPPPAAR